MQPYPPYHPFPCQSKVAIPFDSADSLSPVSHEEFARALLLEDHLEDMH